LRVSVVYCTPDAAWTREFDVAEGATLRAVIDRSGLLAAHPELNAADLTAGVFSRPQPLDALVRDGDRIEIYRHLLVDPKDARRHRAELRRRRKDVPKR